MKYADWPAKRWVFMGLAVLFAIAAAAILVILLISIVSSIVIQSGQGTGTTSYTLVLPYSGAWAWIWTIAVILFFLWLFGRVFGRLTFRMYPLWWHYKHDDVMHILKRRYASGEITHAEFERIKKELEKR